MATGWPISDDSWDRMRREEEKAAERKRQYMLLLVGAYIDVALDTRDRDWFMNLTNLQKELMQA